ncbi:MAG: TonB-dependent receptor [bacterium]
MNRQKFWLLLSFIFAAAAIGQNQRVRTERASQITGRVIEITTGNPVVGANVLVLGTMLGAATDGQGWYSIPQIPPGSYTIMVSAIGYKKEEKTVRVQPGEKIELHFSLEETVILMDGIAVTASRYQQSLSDIPVSLSLVPAKELTDRHITSVDQALRYVPGVNALDGGQISIRGSSGFNWGVGSRVLVLINGHPFMAGDIWNVNWYAIPTSNIKQIEVMKGSGSALYGSSAMGGVINIITEEPDEGSHINVRTFTGLYSRPSHQEWQWTDDKNHFEGTAIDITTRLGPLSALLSSNYQSTTGFKENDDHQVFNLMSSLGYRFNPNLRFNLMSGYGKNTGGFFIYWKGLSQPYGNGSDPYGFRTRSTMKNTYAFPSIDYVMNNRIYLSIKGRYNRASTEDRLQSISEGAELQRDRFRASTATTKGGEAQLNCQVSANGIMVLGGDFQRDQVESIQYGHRRFSRASYYVQYEQRLWEKIKVTLGTRYDWEGGDEIESTGELSRKLGLNLNPLSRTNIRISYGEGFRAPSIGERFVSTFTGGLRVSPNPDLRPEKSKSIEFGIKQALTKSMSLDLALFSTDYNDLIEPQLDTDPDGAVVVRFKNVIKARVRGIDLSQRTDWWSRLVSTKIGYLFIHSKDLTPGERSAPLKYRSKHTVYITNDLMLLPLTFGIDFRYLSKIERVDEYHKAYITDIDKLVPTYVVACRFGVLQEHFAVRFLIDNILQYNYLMSPANMGPPRTATLQLNVNY